MKLISALILATTLASVAVPAVAAIYSPRAPWIGCGMYGGWRC